MTTVWMDVRYALRTLSKNPGVALVALVSLALGIGANATIFTFVSALFLRPLPFAEPSRLVALYTRDEKAPRFLPHSHPNLESLREQSGEVLEGLAVYGFAPMNLSGAGEPERVQGEIVSGNFFTVLGVGSALGRSLLPEDDRLPGAHPVVVLSHGFWSRRFGADPEVVGSTITLSGQPFTVVGVAPPEFRGTAAFNRPDLWVPMQMHDQVLIEPFRSWFDDRRALVFSAVGRLEPGVSLERAQAELDAIAQRLAREFPDDNAGRTVVALPLVQATVDPNVRENLKAAGAILSGIVGLVLLIACANVANLLLSRAVVRRREIAVRLAVGAERRRLVRQLLTESLLLALAAGALGLLLAYALRDTLWALRPPMVAQSAIIPALDVRVLGYTLLVSIATGVLFGLAPALQSTRPEVLPALKNEAPSAGTPRRRFGVRDGLIVAQVALSLLALLGAGLFVRGLRAAQRIDPGFDTEPLAVFTVNVGAQGYDAGRGREFFRRALERLAAAPGIEASAIASNPPLNPFGGPQRSVFPTGTESTPDDRGTLTLTNTVSPGYFDTVGMPILAGRGFTAADREDAPQVAIVNRSAAELFWGARDPIGRRFRFFGEDFDREVVGLTTDVKQMSLGENSQPCIYLPSEQNFVPFMTFFVRASRAPASALAAAQREVREIDPNLPFINAWTLREVVAQSLWAARMAAALLGAFGLLGLLLAAMGTYSVMSYYVSQRAHEIGIHLAVGARRTDILRLMLRRGMGLALAGVLAGLAAGWLATRLASETISGLLYDVSATSAEALLVTASLLVVIALLANLIPASRATRLPLMTVLRRG